MKRKLLLLTLIAASLHARRRAWLISVAAVAGSSVLDIQSSRGHQELNPILGRGPFGSRQVGIKLGLTGGMLAVETMLARKHDPKPYVYANAAFATVLTAGAIRNWRTQ